MSKIHAPNSTTIQVIVNRQFQMVFKIPHHLKNDFAPTSKPQTIKQHLNSGFLLLTWLELNELNVRCFRVSDCDCALLLTLLLSFRSPCDFRGEFCVFNQHLSFVFSFSLRVNELEFWDFSILWPISVSHRQSNASKEKSTDIYYLACDVRNKAHNGKYTQLETIAACSYFRKILFSVWER